MVWVKSGGCGALRTWLALPESHVLVKTLNYMKMAFSEGRCRTYSFADVTQKNRKGLDILANDVGSVSLSQRMVFRIGPHWGDCDMDRHIIG